MKPISRRGLLGAATLAPLLLSPALAWAADEELQDITKGAQPIGPEERHARVAAPRR
jgi:Xaa-Pro dipeptidase